MKILKHCIFATILSVLLVGLGVLAVEQDRTIASLEHELALQERAAQARNYLLKESHELHVAAFEQKRVKEVTVTAYNPVEEQCDEDPLITASLRTVKSGTVAVSRDLFDQGWVFGRKVRIEGLGIFEINDLMNKRYRDRIDVFMWDKSQATRFGRRQLKAALLDI